MKPKIFTILVVILVACQLTQAINKGIQYGIKKGIKKGIRKAVNTGLQRGIQVGALPGFRRGVSRGLRRGLRKGVNTGLKPGLKRGINLAAYFGSNVDSGSLPGVSLEELPGFIQKPSSNQKQPTLPIHQNNYQLPHQMVHNNEVPSMPIQPQEESDPSKQSLTINQRSASSLESPIGCLENSLPKRVNGKWRCVKKSNFDNSLDLVSDYQAGLTDDEAMIDGSGYENEIPPTTTTTKPNTDYAKTEETPEYTIKPTRGYDDSTDPYFTRDTSTQQAPTTREITTERRTTTPEREPTTRDVAGCTFCTCCTSRILEF